MESTNTFKPLPDCKPRGPCAHSKPTLSILIPSNAMALSQARPHSHPPKQQALDISGAVARQSERQRGPTPPSAEWSPMSWDNESESEIADPRAQDSSFDAYMQAQVLAQARDAWEQECQMRWCRFIRSPLPSIFPCDAAGGAATGSASRSSQSDATALWIVAGSTPVIGPDGFVFTPVDAPDQGKSDAGPGSGPGLTGSDDDDGGCLFGCFNRSFSGCFK